MPNYRFTADLIQDVLFRAEEVQGNTAFQEAVVRYLNRAYQAIWTGGAEFQPSIKVDWVWLRTSYPVVLEQLPIYTTGTIALTQGSNQGGITPAPTLSLADYMLHVVGARQRYRILLHTALNPTITLDSVYLDETVTAASFTAYKVFYALPDDFLRFSQPARMYNGNYTIDGVDEDTLDEQYPAARIQTGLPHQFALVGEKLIRFSHAGDHQGRSNRIEFHHLRQPLDLTSPGTTEEPLVPMKDRRLIADGALFWMHRDKNDSRAADMGQAFQAGIQAMKRDNEFAMGQMDSSFGKIMPRTPAPTRPRHGSTQTRVGGVVA